MVGFFRHYEVYCSCAAGYQCTDHAKIENGGTEIRQFFTRRKDGGSPAEADFRELIPNGSDKYDVSVTFSSVLEMMKESRLDAEQKKLFGDITVRATERLFEDTVDPEGQEEAR